MATAVIAKDKLLGRTFENGQPYTKSVAVTPSDTDELEFVSRGLHIGGAGNITVVMADGGDAVTKAVLAGTSYPWRVKQVLAGAAGTATTATGIFAEY